MNDLRWRLLMAFALFLFAASSFLLLRMLENR